jgi:hypothetical protein
MIQDTDIVLFMYFIWVMSIEDLLLLQYVLVTRPTVLVYRNTYLVIFQFTVGYNSEIL